MIENRHLSENYHPDDLQLYNVWKVFQMPENPIVDELARQGIELTAGTLHRKIEALQNGHLSKMEYLPDDLQLYNVWKVFQMPENQIVDELARQGIEIPRKTLEDKIHKMVGEKRQLANLATPDDLQLYNVWNFARNNNETSQDAI